jgi:anti-sigma factor RsiW
MMRTDNERGQRSGLLSDRRLWQRSRLTDVPEDEAARYLDLAAFAEGRLETDEKERVAALLADDPETAADVRAARTLASVDEPSTELQRVIARASALFPEADPVPGRVIPLVRRRGGPAVRVVAEWGSIAAAIALASWLGFSMGSDTSLALTSTLHPSETSFLPDLFDSAPGFLRDIGEGLRT